MKTRIGFFFGGRSSEHEVSVITALQAYNNLNQEKYEIIPIYVSKSGDFFTSPKFLDLKNYKDITALLLSATKITLGRKDGKGGMFTSGFLSSVFTPIDVAFPAFHGGYGEDGSMQGLFEVFQIPYVGFNVIGSAVGMDKTVAKALFASLGIPLGKYHEIKRIDWDRDAKKCLSEVIQKLKFPLFVKPSTAGSTIGINKAKDKDSLQFAIEVAATYSEKVLVEESFEDVIEVNCSGLGYEEVQASVCEMPIPKGETLTFEDKYMRGGKGSKGTGMASLDRIIPAPIPDKLTKQIQDTTIKVFKAMDGCGVARIDFFVDKKKTKFWINEINTIPGSLSFYLWNKTGIDYPELLDILINSALKRFENQQKTQHTFDTPLLSQMAQSGSLSGTKRSS